MVAIPQNLCDLHMIIIMVRIVQPVSQNHIVNVNSILVKRHSVP